MKTGIWNYVFGGWSLFPQQVTYGYALTLFFHQVDSNGEVLRRLTWMQQQNAKGCVLKVDIEYL